LDIDVLLDRILNNLEKVISFVTANVMFVDKGRTFIASGRGYTTDKMEKWRQAWDVPVDEFPILKRMAENGQPVVFPDTWREPAWVRLTETDWIRSYAGAPILRGGRLYGFINVNSDVPGEYGERSVVHLRAFADQAAIALENARLFSETQKRAERLQLLNEIARSINEPGSLDLVLNAAADGLAKVLDVEQTGIALMDEDGENLTIVAEHTAHGISSAVGGKIPVHGNASMEFMLEQLKPLPVYEAQKDPLLANIQPIMQERQVSSILLVPLVVRGALIGTIGCDVIHAPRHFSDEEIRLAETMAGMISTRIEQTRLLESIQRHAGELEKTREILHVINATPDISLGIERVAKTIKELTGCARVSLALLTETGEQFLLVTIDNQVDGLKNGIPINVSDTAASDDILRGEAHLTADLAQETDFPAERALYQAGYRSRVNYPLLSNEGIIGALNLVWKEEHGFAGNNPTMIRQLAEAVAMAVERGQLLEETRRRDAILEILAYAAEKLMHLDDLGEVLPDLLERLGKITGASRAYLFKNHLDQTGELLMSEEFGWIDEQALPISKGTPQHNVAYQASGLGRWISVLQTGKPIHGLVRDLPPDEKGFLSQENILSVAIVPVFVRGTWWGLLGLDDCRWDRIWTSTEIEALKNLGDTIGGAIARIQSEIAEREQLSLTEALRDVTNVMTATTNIEQVLQHILDSITRIVKHDASNIMLLRAGMLEITCAQGYVESGLPDPAAAFPRPISEFKHFQAALETGESQIINDTHTQNEWLRLPEVRWVRSNLNAPIRYKEQTIGFINLDSSVPNYFSEEDAKRLLAFANQAAVAIENTRLFEETHDRALQMSLLNRITQAAIGAGTIDDVLHTLVVQIAALMNSDLAFINLLDENDRKSQITMSSANTFSRVTNPDLLNDIAILTEEALNKGHVQFFENLRSVEFLERTMVQQLGGASLLTLPLISGDQHLGGAVIIYQQRKVFDVNMLALGEQAAGQIALAIAKTRLLENERQKSDTLARVNTILTALSHVAVRLETAREPDEVLDTLGEELRKLGIACLVWMVSPDHQALIFRYGSFGSSELRMIQRLLGTKLEDYRLEKGSFEYFDRVIGEKEPIFIENFRNALHTVVPDLSPRVFGSISNRLGLSELVSGFFLPLMAEEKVIGTIWMLAQQFTQHDQTAATIFSGQVAMALENTRLYQHIQQLAITDELTKLYNRRGLMELGNREFDRARRFNRSLFAIMYDLDDFRKVNNTYGHAVGDEVLREVAARCRTVLRSTDVIGRYGGEEFTVLLPETDLAGAREIAERLRMNVAAAPITTSKGKVRLSISLGVAPLEKQCESLVDLLDWADQGLYQAKRSGKNRVCISTNRKKPPEINTQD
ncbi:MAG: GAF domain-containing protein, partial [Anaerolineales bacterium]